MLIFAPAGTATARALQRPLAYLGLVAACVCGASAHAQTLDDDALLAAMIATVVTHDVAIPVGFSPTPFIQLSAEAVELSANLGLKAYRPLLQAPADIARYPDGDGDSDSCSYSFYLPSASAEYENLFGVIPLREPLYDHTTNQLFAWKNRWGELGSPSRLYHANSTVTVGVRSTDAVRRFDAATGAFTDDEFPIPADDFQQVYFPIGTHHLEWSAATQLNFISDVAFPTGLLAIGVLSEIKNGKLGLQAGKKVKQDGLGDSAADAAGDAADSKAANKAKQKLGEKIKGLLRTCVKPGKKWEKEFCDNVNKEIAGLACDLSSRLRGLGIEIVEAETGAALAARGDISATQKLFLEAVYAVAVQNRRDLATAGMCAFVSNDVSEDGDEIVAELLLALLGNVDRGLEIFGRPFRIEDFFTIDSALSTATQTVTIWDNVPPVWTSDPPPVTLEASDFGGTRRYRAIDTLRAAVEPVASDNCGRQPILSSDTPELLPMGETIVTWTAADQGPNPADGQDYGPTAQQTIIVQDTQPPLLLAPPSKVIESSDAEVSLADAAIGAAVAIDLADVQPAIANNAPAGFPLDHRSEVQWTATDDSGNQAQDAQWITVKTTGTNTAPTAHEATAQTLTAQPVDIRLTANDDDVLDGRPDPLWFRISAHPQHGEFIAPLYPFFITDYRTGAQDGLGAGYDPANDEIYSYITVNYCQQQLPPPPGFVHQALFVHVTDDGIRYVLDQFFTCNQDNAAEVGNRISRWDRDGNFLGQMRFGPNPEDTPRNDAFVLDRDGFIYYNQYLSTGSSAEMNVIRCSADFVGDTDHTQVCSTRGKFVGNSVPGDQLDVAFISYVRIDSDRDVAYIADMDDVFAFRLVAGADPRYLGELGPRDASGVLADWLGAAPGMEVGADGSLYVVDSAYHRIHKFAPPSWNDAGDFVPGTYTGWAGRCTGSGNKACDEDLERSRGYSCTFEADSCVVADGQLAGARQGQFNTPKYLAIDPNDVLYVADYANERVQRFSPDGSFAGEAVSEGSGINKGDRPSFVLGNMGRPQSVSVNSSQFFVVDRDEQFVHSFGTLPFKDIADDAVTVTYVSGQDFHSATDSFAFTVSDGLVDSTPATVSIRVDRNQRAPIALAAALETDEDTPLTITLAGDDPDGIAGEDFNGLDTLTFAITAQPLHGALSGSDASWTYTPDPDYYGDDEIRFAAGDGVFTSEPAAVTISVLPVNDPPVVTLEAPTRAARGFPTLVNSTFADDPSADYQAAVVWGDGSADTTGAFVDDNGDDPRIEGVAISAPPLPEQDGRTFALHTFDTPGVRTLQLCLADSDAASGCDSAAVSVEDLVSLGVGATVYAEPRAADGLPQTQIADDVPFKYELTIVNERPGSWTGLTASDVTLSGELPADLDIGDIQITQGTCSRSGTALSCTLGSLTPGEEVTLVVIVQGPGNLIYNEDRDFEGELKTTAPALEDTVSFYVSTELLADATDSDDDGMTDVFELTYGLNTMRDDASADADSDGLSNFAEFDAHTSPNDIDSDDDGLSDHREVIELLTDPLNADTDGDALPDYDEVTQWLTDPLNPDSDDDGMLDGWEAANSLDPLLDDSALDADGDGRSNLAEYQQGGDPQRDDVAPELTPPPDATVNASGVLTAVALGVATADDARDGALAPIALNPGPFAPGVHTVTWSATDAAGNSAEAAQRVAVVPMVSFAVDRTVTEGDTVQVAVELNGPAVVYPVTVPYVVGGSALNPSDHNAVSGFIQIDTGISAGIAVDIVRDAVAESDETLVLTMGTPVNAVPGARTTHTITIVERNLAPVVTITAEQQGSVHTTVAADAGAVIVTAQVRDDSSDSHAWDWSASDAGVMNPMDYSDESYRIEPGLLNEGVYGLRVRVTDNGIPVAATGAQSWLKVIATPPLLSSDVDTDGDGVSDADEGLSDSDGDRIPDWLDDLPNTNMLRMSGDGRIVETDAGLKLRLGRTVFQDNGFYCTLGEAALAEEVDYGYPDGVVDFEIDGLEPGGSAQLVVPLQRPLPANGRYRKYANGSWRDFVVDGHNALSSAPGAQGACPPPGSARYETGLTPGDGCLQLTLEDGGPNDADNQANGGIQDPGGLAVPVGVSLTLLSAEDRTAGAGSETVVMRLRLSSESGDVELSGLTLRASGSGDDRLVQGVRVIVDANANGLVDDGEESIATGRFDRDDGTLQLETLQPYPIPAGDTDLLVTLRL